MDILMLIFQWEVMDIFRCIAIRYDTIRWTILTCAQKLTSSQLSLPHGTKQKRIMNKLKQTLECGPMPNVMVALPNIGGALCSTPQSSADAHY